MMNITDTIFFIITIILWLISVYFQINIHPKSGNKTNDTFLSVTFWTFTLFYLISTNIIYGNIEHFLFNKSIEQIAKEEAKILLPTLVTSLSTVYAGIIIGFSMHRQARNQASKHREKEEVIKKMNVIIFGALLWFSFILMI